MADKTPSQADAVAVNDFTCTPCGQKTVKTKALHQCLDCNAFYCGNCLEKHNESTDLRYVILHGKTKAFMS